MSAERPYWPIPQPHFRLNADTREERHALTARVQAAIHAAHAFIIDVHQFSNKSLVLNVETIRARVPELVLALKTVEGLSLHTHADQVLEEARAALVGLTDEQRRESVAGTVQITFFHNEPDLAIEVPKVPG